MGDVIERLRIGETPPAADALLADAREALAGSGVESQLAASRRDVRRAVLLAAIASEVKIKQTLREKTPADRRAVVDVLLDNYREVDVAIAQLPHKAMKAAVGRSLHEEAADLFQAVVQLFTHRNQIAHYWEGTVLTGSTRRGNRSRAVVGLARLALKLSGAGAALAAPEAPTTAESE